MSARLPASDTLAAGGSKSVRLMMSATIAPAAINAPMAAFVDCGILLPEEGGDGR
jgi:hypothetical protein